MDYLYICCLKCDSSSLSYNCIAFGLLYEKCSLNFKAFNYTLLHFLSRFVIIQNAVLVEMEEIKNTNILRYNYFDKTFALESTKKTEISLTPTL